MRYREVLGLTGANLLINKKDGVWEMKKIKIITIILCLFFIAGLAFAQIEEEEKIQDIGIKIYKGAGFKINRQDPRIRVIGFILRREGVRGVQITGVESNSVGEKLGLKPYDIVLRINGTKINNVDDLKNVISTFKAGEEITFDVIRDFERISFSGAYGEAKRGKEITTQKLDIFTKMGHSLSVTSTALLPDKKNVLIANNKNAIVLWNMAENKQGKVFLGHTDLVNTITVSSDGRIFISSGNDKTIRFWDIYTGKMLRKLDLDERIRAITLSNSGRVLASVGYERDTIRIYDSSSGVLSRVLKLDARGWLSTVRFTPDDKYLVVGGQGGTIYLVDPFSGNIIERYLGLKMWIRSLSISPDGSFIAASEEIDNRLVVWDAKSKEIVSTTEATYGRFTDDNKHMIVAKKDGSILLWDFINNKEIKKFVGHKGNVSSIEILDDKRSFVSGSYDGTARVWDISTSKELAQFSSFADGEWIIITPEGYYNASPNGDKYLNVRVDNNVYSIENYRETFYRPDLVKLAISGGSLKGLRTLSEVKQPPVVEIIDTPASSEKDEIKVTVRLTDQGGGIGDVRLYLNETAVLVDSTRGVKIVAKPNEKTVYKTYTIKLLNGENTIKAVAFNGDNTMQSNPAYHKVMASLEVKKPSLYAVVIGINEYKNPKLELKYAVADAKLFADTLKQVASPLFEKVEVRLLATKGETTKEAIKKSLEEMKRLSPEDVFVFYVASHGTVDEGEYFLVTSNVGSLSTFRLKEDALTQTELKELIANVPSTKKFIVIDTCNAGKLGEALQVAMLTRGMSEETAMKILSKAVGSTILSASTSLQEALEGYQGHGLFTYVLAEGMKGKADTDRDGFIRTLELANYVDSEVPTLAEKVFKRAQYPTATPSGQAFPIGRVR